jgi:hypothetical protein
LPADLLGTTVGKDRFDLGPEYICDSAGQRRGWFLEIVLKVA